MLRIGPVAAIGLALASLPAAAVARTIEVHPGQSIQSAVDRARPGDRVLVRPGTYREPGRRCPGRPRRRCAVAVTTDEVRLVARPRPGRPVVLRARRGQTDGVAVGKSAGPACAGGLVAGSRVAGLTVRGFRDAVVVACAERFRITRTRTFGPRSHGILISRSALGQVDRSSVGGADHAGLRVTRSRDVRVHDNRARRNATGFEIAGSADVRADHNVASRNAAGIVSVAPPGRWAEPDADVRLDHNLVVGNNLPNPCLERRAGMCRVPRGTGILVLAADRNVVEANRIHGNSGVGLAVTSYCTSLGLPAPRCADSSPDDNLIAANLTTGNGDGRREHRRHHRRAGGRQRSGSDVGR
jgi:hypothetical protein